MGPLRPSGAKRLFQSQHVFSIVIKTCCQTESLGAWMVDSWGSLILRNYSLLSDSDSNE